jgi:hypothetical protein
MKKWTIALMYPYLFLAMLTCAGATVAAEDERAESFHWQGKVASGKTVEIKGINGGINAEAASGDQVELTATRRGARSDPTKVEIKMVEHPTGITFCAVYPSEDSSKPNECVPGEGGRMKFRDNDVNVQFSLLVPAGVRFIGRTVNGGVEANGLAGDAEAFTVNGRISISTKGWAQAKTVNGSITVSMAASSLLRPTTFQTVNGSVTVSFQSGINASLEAETVNGSISTDFPLTVQGKFGPKKIQGTLGNGGEKLRLATVNGSIQIGKAP